MKSERFSGFGAFTADQRLKERVLRALETARRPAAVKRKARRLAFAAAALMILLAAGLYALIPRAVSSGKNYRILNRAPLSLLFSGSADLSLAAAPSEKELYSSSDIIFYGKAVGFSWVELSGEKDPLSRFRTIVTFKTLKDFKGNLKQGEKVRILLPFAITGTGTGYHVEDNENACGLKKGSEAFIFAKKFGSGDLIGEAGRALRADAICAYGTDWGDEHILPNRNGSFEYFFKSGTSLTLDETEALILRRINGGWN